MPSHPLNKGKLCAKGEAMLENIYDPERLKYPLKRTAEGWQRIFWETALAEIAEKLLILKNQFGPAVLGVDGDEIIVETNRGQVHMMAKVEERLAEGLVIVPHGWPGEANANLLTDTQCGEPIMGYPEVKALLCAIRKA